MDRLQKIVRAATPGTGVQFRREAYGNSGTRSFLRDVLAMANAAVDGSRYIITGASVDKRGQKKLAGIDRQDFLGKPSYQSLVTDFIEPPIRIKYRPVTLNNRLVGVFEIADCQDKPYMMRIDQSEQLRRGDAYVRMNEMPIKMGRRQLQEMFENKFRDSVSADRIEIGFAGEIIHKELRIPTTDFSKLPSAIAGAKLRELIDFRESSEGPHQTTGVVRLVHARLFGADRPYEEQSAEELMFEMDQIEHKHRLDDEIFLFEENSRNLQLVVLNQGDEAIEDASISLVMPNHEAFYVASSLPKKRLNGGYTERSAAEIADYPAITLKDELVHASNTMGDLLPHVPVQVFETPIRICVGSALKGRKIGIRYSLFAKNLRKPAKGKLRLLF